MSTKRGGGQKSSINILEHIQANLVENKRPILDQLLIHDWLLELFFKKKKNHADHMYMTL